jgi:hypothetical protein
MHITHFENAHVLVFTYIVELGFLHSQRHIEKHEEEILKAKHRVKIWLSRVVKKYPRQLKPIVREYYSRAISPEAATQFMLHWLSDSPRR